MDHSGSSKCDIGLSSIAAMYTVVWPLQLNLSNFLIYFSIVLHFFSITWEKSSNQLFCPPIIRWLLLISSNLFNYLEVLIEEKNHSSIFLIYSLEKSCMICRVFFSENFLFGNYYSYTSCAWSYKKCSGIIIVIHWSSRAEPVFCAWSVEFFSSNFSYFERYRLYVLMQFITSIVFYNLFIEANLFEWSNMFFVLLKVR